MPQQALIEHAKHHNVDYIDVTSLIESRIRDDIAINLARRDVPSPSSEEMGKLYELHKNRYFLDLDHLTFEGHELLAMKLAEHLHNANLVELNPDAFYSDWDQITTLNALTPYVVAVPSNLNTSFDLGNSLRILGHLAEAAQVYQLMIRRQQDAWTKARLYYLMGESYREYGDEAAASTAFIEASALAVDDIELYKGLYYSWRQLGNQEQAEVIKQAIYQFAPDTKL